MGEKKTVLQLKDSLVENSWRAVNQERYACIQTSLLQAIVHAQMNEVPLLFHPLSVNTLAEHGCVLECEDPTSWIG